jgi:hypothetical protein
MSEIIGVAFPIPKFFIPRFFVDKKTVFIKPATIFKELKPGMKFVFYQSREDTGYIGQAIIRNVTFAEDPFYFFEIYLNDIYLTKDELRNYIETNEKWKTKRTRRRCKTRSRKWIAIELESISKYDTPIKPKQFIPVSGKYINSEPNS